MIAEANLDAVIAGPRGLPYPSISLKTAVRRAFRLGAHYDATQKFKLAEAGALWGYRPKSSGIALTASALKQFGLVDDYGSGASRSIQLSRLFYREILEAESEDQGPALKKAALSPRVFRERFARWGLRNLDYNWRLNDLQAAYGYSETTAATFMKSFDETVQYAKLTKADQEKTLDGLKEGVRHYVLNAEPGSYRVASGSTDDDINIIVPAVGHARVTPPGILGELTLQGTARVGPLTKRFTFQTDEGVVTLEVPSPLSKKSISEIFIWFVNLVRLFKSTAPDRDKGAS